MAQKYNTLFKDLANSVKGTPMSGWLLLLCIAIFCVGVNFFAEDLKSSMEGMKSLETNYDLNVSSWDATFWAGSGAFQLVSVVAFFVFLSNRNKYWAAFWISLGTQCVDVFFDMWYRTKGQLFIAPDRFIVAFLYTLLVTVILSEVFISFGFGSVQALFVDGLEQLGLFVASLASGVLKFFGQIGKLAKPKTQRHPQARIVKSGNGRGMVKPRQPTKSRGRPKKRTPDPVWSKLESSEDAIKFLDSLSTKK